MNCNAKNINAIVEKTKALLKHHQIAHGIVMHNPPKIDAIVNEKGVAKIQAITFTNHWKQYVQVTPCGIYVSPTNDYLFGPDDWEEFLAIDEGDAFCPEMLETGMLVTTECGRTYIVMKNTRIHEDGNPHRDGLRYGVLIEIGGDDYIQLSDYGMGLKSRWCQRQHNNIVKVSLPINFGFNKTLEEMGEEIIWQKASE